MHYDYGVFDVLHGRIKSESKAPATVGTAPGNGEDWIGVPTVIHSMPRPTDTAVEPRKAGV